MKKLYPCIALLVVLIGAQTVAAQEVSVLDEDERLIESAGLRCEGRELVEFFRARACIESESGKVDEMVRRFSGPSLQDRIQAGSELIAVGPLAIPCLRRVLNDLEEPEVRDRARRCLGWIEGPSSVTLTTAAARVIGRRKPTGAAEALLAYLPFAGNEEVTRAVTAALRAVAVKDGKADPVLVRALSDAMPLRRAIAATVLSQAAPLEQREAIEKLLQDPNPEVRMTAALAQAKAANAAAFPVLIDLLAVLPVNKRTQVEEVLQEWAGDWAPGSGPTGEDEVARRIRRDGWAGWWKNADGPSLLAMLDKRTLGAADQKKVMDAIRRLNHNDYATREKATAELNARGRMILPLLREALKNNEAEVVRRAQGLIQRIEEEPAHRLPTAALRALGLRKPAGAAATLLAFLPFAEEENLTEAQSAMALLAMRDGKPDPVVMGALTDPRSLIRAAAAEALAQGGGAGARPAVRKLLDDPDVTVRLRTALALAPHDAEAIPVLIGLIAALPEEQAGRIHDFLTPLAGDTPPSAPADSADSRKKSSAGWATWWKDNAPKADLAKLASSYQTLLGFTVICEHSTGRILELGRDRKVRWSFNGTQNPTDVISLPNNRVLVAEYTGSKVTERDLKGGIIWQKQTSGNPHNIQRLPNGHTLIASNVQVVEVDRNGKDVFMLKEVTTLVNTFGQLTGAYKTRKGQYICVTQNGRCVHFDAAGKQLKFFDTNRGNAWVDLTPNGRILLTQNGGNKVAEYELDGKLLMEIDVPQVCTATGLPNGNIIATCNQTGRVMEMDRKGKILWEYKSNNPFRSRGR